MLDHWAPRLRGVAMALVVAAPATAQGPLDSHGVEIMAAQTVDASVFDDGRSAGRAIRGITDVGVSLDFSSLLGIPGATFFAQGLFLLGANGSDAVGGVQAFSNIDATPFTGPGELWYEQRLMGERLRWKVGRVDAATEFAAVNAAAGFLNAAFGLSPTFSRAPTYPSPAPSVNVFVQPAFPLSLAVGAYAAADYGSPSDGDGPFYVAEAAIHQADPGAVGRTALGVWRAGGSGGWYVLGQRSLAMDDGSPRVRLVAFALAGRADHGGADARLHLASGMVARAPFKKRPDDEAGFGYTGVLLPDGGTEQAFEAYYGLRVAPWLEIRPDLQHLRTGSRGVTATTLRIVMIK